MKIIVDGEFDIEDESGQKVHAVKGDVFYCTSFTFPLSIYLHLSSWFGG